MAVTAMDTRVNTTPKNCGSTCGNSMNSKTVLRLGTPPSCTNLTTYIVALWNQAMSGADTVRGLHESNKQKLGGGAGPITNMIELLLSYATNNIDDPSQRFQLI